MFAILLATALTFGANTVTVDNLYPLVGQVVYTYEDNGNKIIQIMDEDGMIWEWGQEKTEHFYVDELTAMVMNDMGTENKEDDEIIKIVSIGVPCTGTCF